MDERKQVNLTIVKNTEGETQAAKPSVVRHTNPIMKKMLKFHMENKGKLKILDLFKP